MTKAQTTTASSRKKLVIYDYEEAWWHMVERIFDSFHMLDPLLRFFPPVRVPHAGPYRYTQEDRTLDQQSDPVTYKATGDVDLREGDVKGHTAFIYDFARSYVKTVAAQTFARVPEVAELVGNSFGADGQPFSVETFLRAVETVQLHFVGDEDLSVSIVAHPEAEPGKCLFIAPPGAIIGFVHIDTLEKVKQASWTKEQQERYDGIVARKREEQRAAKRTRRLS